MVKVRLGIALEGGGVRCAAQVGALLGLMELGIRPQVFAGCGTGALVAALGALDKLSEEVAFSFLPAATKNGLLRNALLNRQLQKVFGNVLLRDTAALAMPTVDLESGAVQVLASHLPFRPDPRPWSRQALVSTAVRCAMAAPGVLPPVAWRGRRILGGGHLRGTLLTLLAAMGADHVLCIRVLEGGCAQYETHPAAHALCAHALVAAPPPMADLIIQVSGVQKGKGVLDRETALPLLGAGRAAARKALPALQALQGSHAGKILAFPGAGDGGP